MRIPLLAISILLPQLLRGGTTTIDPAAAHAYGANIGWINARGDISNGATVGEFICSGYIYSANVGWINLGSGAPTNGIRYQNDAATDYGVNTQEFSSVSGTVEAKLRGYAYSGNIGWISFETTGNPRVDLTRGELKGYAYSANAGWISLSGSGVITKTTSFAPATDSDGDMIPDAWERTHAGDLSTMTLITDSDGDGFSDSEEYTADTNPRSSGEMLRITNFIPPRQLAVAGPFMTDLTWTSNPTRFYSIEINTELHSAWATSATGIPSAGTTTTKSFIDTPTAVRFYRIRAKLPFAP